MSPRLNGLRLASLALVIGLVLLAPALPARAAGLCFTATGQCIGHPLAGRFSDPLPNFWQTNGGLPVFGFPIATLAPETSRDTGQVYLTQWFERERLELHPEKQPPYTILLGRLGAERLQQQGRNWMAFPKASPAAPHYFAITGHAIAPQFWGYWSSHGLDLGDPGVSSRESLALFGYPLSETALETNSSGDTVLTQWFERARFEYHPNNPAPYTVLLGLLGNETRPTGPIVTPFYENRVDSPVELLASYYDAINRKEYHRAYGYWESPGSGAPGQPGNFASFAAGYATTAYVAVTLGVPTTDAGAGNVYGQVAAVIVSTHIDGTVQTFTGCYTTHHTNPGIDPNPTAVLWKLRSAAIAAGPSNATPASLLPGQSCQP